MGSVFCLFFLTRCPVFPWPYAPLAPSGPHHWLRGIHTPPRRLSPHTLHHRHSAATPPQGGENASNSDNAAAPAAQHGPRGHGRQGKRRQRLPPPLGSRRAGAWRGERRRPGLRRAGPAALLGQRRRWRPGPGSPRSAMPVRFRVRRRWAARPRRGGGYVLRWAGRWAGGAPGLGAAGPAGPCSRQEGGCSRLWGASGEASKGRPLCWGAPANKHKKEFTPVGDRVQAVFVPETLYT